MWFMQSRGTPVLGWGRGLGPSSSGEGSISDAVGVSLQVRIGLLGGSPLPSTWPPSSTTRHRASTLFIAHISASDLMPTPPDVPPPPRSQLPPGSRIVLPRNTSLGQHHDLERSASSRCQRHQPRLHPGDSEAGQERRSIHSGSDGHCPNGSVSSLLPPARQRQGRYGRPRAALARLPTTG